MKKESKNNCDREWNLHCIKRNDNIINNGEEISFRFKYALRYSYGIVTDNINQ